MGQRRLAPHIQIRAVGETSLYVYAPIALPNKTASWSQRRSKHRRRQKSLALACNLRSPNHSAVTALTELHRITMPLTWTVCIETAAVCNVNSEPKLRHESRNTHFWCVRKIAKSDY
jgi:hypothetical protein